MPAILFSEMTPGADWEHEFNNWYDTEHIPLRMDVPGFTGARRYKNPNGEGYLAVYEMTDSEVLQSEPYRQVKENPSELTARMLREVSGFTRYTCEQIGKQVTPGASNPYDAAFVYPVMFSVPEHREEEFNRWYDEEHVPLLLRNEHWVACRRYRIVSGEPGPWTHLALHYLSDLRALESKEREEARTTEWRTRLAQEEWFKGSYSVYKLIKTFEATSKAAE